jgi:hypothetical protein
MAYVLKHGARYFRVEVVEVISPDESSKTVYHAWCSEAFRELKDLPAQTLARFIPGPPAAKQADALAQACDWIKSTWDTQQARRTFKADKSPAVTYIVRLFKDDHAVDFEFEDFTDAKTFGRAAEKGIDITKVGITNNESPQYLTVWERGK